MNSPQPFSSSCSSLFFLYFIGGYIYLLYADKGPLRVGAEWTCAPGPGTPGRVPKSTFFRGRFREANFRRSGRLPVDFGGRFGGRNGLRDRFFGVLFSTSISDVFLCRFLRSTRRVRTLKIGFPSRREHDF